MQEMYDHHQMNIGRYEVWSSHLEIKKKKKKKVLAQTTQILRQLPISVQDHVTPHHRVPYNFFQIYEYSRHERGHVSVHEGEGQDGVSTLRACLQVNKGVRAISLLAQPTPSFLLMPLDQPWGLALRLVLISMRSIPAPR